MTPAEFAETDPRDMAALVRQWMEKRRREDLRFATIACMIANSNPFRGKDDKPIQPADVFSSLPRIEEEGPTLAEKIIQFAEARGARDEEVGR